MQAPFIYVQVLSSLVHINNIVNAVSFGLTWGAAVGTILVHWRMHIEHLTVGKDGSKVEAAQEQAEQEGGDLLVSFFFSCFGPFVYQALLEVSIAISQPFSNRDAVIPTDRMIKALEKDLREALLASKAVTWQ